MWVYQKMLQYPARVRTTNPRLAKAVITQYGGPDGELAASLRYLTQRYTMPIPEAKAALTDIGTEELAHMEIVATLVYNLIKDASIAEIKRAGAGRVLRRSRQGPVFCERRRDALDSFIHPIQGRSHHRYPRKHGCRTKSPLHLRVPDTALRRS